MTIRLIEGLHLTATNKRHMEQIIAKGWTCGASGRISYTLTPIEARPGFYAYHLAKAERDDWGRATTRETRGVIDHIA